MIARIIVQGVLADVYSPYEARSILRSIPDRKWDKRGKCWVIPTIHVTLTADALRALGCTVYVNSHTGEPWNGHGGHAPHGQRDRPAPHWIDAAFSDVPPANVPKLRRGLLAAFHPDAGGRPDLAVQINQAADRRELEGRRNP